MLLLPLLLVAFGAGASSTTENVEIDAKLLKTGDVILHTSTSGQAPAVMIASASRYSHVGLIVVEKGGPVVIEAVGPVKKTKLQSFLRRGVGGNFTVLRHKDVDDKRAQLIAKAAQKHLGKPYDLAFAKGTAKLYCSELVAFAYADAGLDVGKWQKVSELHLDNPVVDALLEKRWRMVPVCAKQKTKEACFEKMKDTEILTPGSLRDDDDFSVVASSYGPFG